MIIITIVLVVLLVIGFWSGIRLIIGPTSDQLNENKEKYEWNWGP